VLKVENVDACRHNSARGLAIVAGICRSMRISRFAKTHPAIRPLQTVGSLEQQRPPWILTGKSADLIQLPKLVLGECEFDRPEIVLKLVKAFRANDDRGYYRLCQEPCERETCRTTFMCFAIGAITSRILQVRSLSTTGKS
jgi:hypothetical protein